MLGVTLFFDNFLFFNKILLIPPKEQKVLNVIQWLCDRFSLLRHQRSMRLLMSHLPSVEAKPGKATSETRIDVIHITSGFLDRQGRSASWHLVVSLPFTHVGGTVKPEKHVGGGVIKGKHTFEGLYRWSAPWGNPWLSELVSSLEDFSPTPIVTAQQKVGFSFTFTF